MREILQLMDEELASYIVGGVHYKDDSGPPYETVLCRKFNHETRRFEREENSDYEYEDYQSTSVVHNPLFVVFGEESEQRSR